MNEIFDTLTDTGTDYTTAKAKLTEHFAPKRNKDYYRCVFGDAKQYEQESMVDFHTRLQQLAVYCEFVDKESSIKTLVESLIMVDLKLVLKAIVTDQDRSTVNKVVQPKVAIKQNARNSKLNAKTCYHCGGAWPHAQQCPAAMGKHCNICNKRNYYARCCQQAKVHASQNTSQSNVNKLSCTATASASPGPSEVTSDDYDDDDSDYVFGLGNKSKLPSVDVFLGQHAIIRLSTSSIVNTTYRALL